VVVLDRAYEPLRLSGQCSLGADALDRVWQLWSPNKALGLTGVRGAYAIAPLHGLALARSLEHLAPSWPLGAHAVAMLQAWVQVDAQHWLAQCREQLAEWKAAQITLLGELGWVCLPSEANYFCARTLHALDVPVLRAQGIKLRDTESLGLPGHWRLGALPPAAQEALQAALHNNSEGGSP
jgi:histidinol-phosphate aminotransferase